MLFILAVQNAFFKYNWNDPLSAVIHPRRNLSRDPAGFWLEPPRPTQDLGFHIGFQAGIIETFE